MSELSYRSVMSGEHELRVADTGTDGRPIVLLPGMTMSITRWVGAGYVEPLAAERRVIVVDPLGHGDSAHCDNEAHYRIGALVEHMVDVLDALDVESADFWGYSRGALMANRLAHDHPHRVRSVVYGGNVLFDGRAVLDSFGMLPDPEVVAAAHERAMAGDWSAYWEHFPVPLPEATKADIETRNHLPSIAAASKAGREDNVVWSKAPASTFAYWGSEEIFHSMNLDAAADAGLPHAVIAGGHAGAYDPAGPALEVVLPFLNQG